ncbi:MAG: DNA adenine methylase, partial [Pigeon pea little leaf phytoplasma]|nr:DNA adenine methylase [Pigeon pea little leaf phytoplasma]
MKIPWIGSKKKMLPLLLKNMPVRYHNYFEPFLGGGTLFQSKSALFYVLLKYAFWGIFRYLSDGTIHLSFGFRKRFSNPIIDLAEIQKIKNNVQNLKLLNGDFE